MQNCVVPASGKSYAQINYPMTMNNFDVGRTDTGAFLIADKEPLIDEFAHSQYPAPRP